MAYQGVIEDFQRIRENKIPGRIPCVACSEEFDVKWHMSTARKMAEF